MQTLPEYRQWRRDVEALKALGEKLLSDPRRYLGEKKDFVAELHGDVVSTLAEEDRSIARLPPRERAAVRKEVEADQGHKQERAQSRGRGGGISV